MFIMRRYLVLILSVSFLLAACQKPEEIAPGKDTVIGNESNLRKVAATTPTRDDNMALGNPGKAVTDITSPNNYLMIKPQYALSYNNSKGRPNWVSWHLNATWKGNSPRVDAFQSDMTLPPSFVKVTPDDYKNSGFDKGHLCPSEDRDENPIDNKTTFLMTNMIPQAPANNQVTWRNMEAYLQHLALNGSEVYIVSGGYGTGGTGYLRGTGEIKAKTIGNGKVAVPARVWKVALILPEGDNDLSRITPNTRIIAVDVPNTQDAKLKKWYEYRVSVDAIEKKTGLNLFNLIPLSIQKTIEAKTDSEVVL